MQGELFAVKRYYEVILDHFSTELGRRGGHELLTFCWQLMRASAWMVAQELNQLITAVPEGPTSAVRQPRDSPISSNGTEYLARTTSASAFQILEIMPATAP
jgi:hypothetical protein